MQALLFKKDSKMAGACIYLFWWKNDISETIEDSDAENTKKTKKIHRISYVLKTWWYKLFYKYFCVKQLSTLVAPLNRTFHLSSHENILTVALINVHYFYNIYWTKDGNKLKRQLEKQASCTSLRARSSIYYGIKTREHNDFEGRT